MADSGNAFQRRLSRLVRQRRGGGRVPRTDDGIREGRVEEFSPQMVQGWLAVETGAPSVEVSLRVNGRSVATTHAAKPSARTVPGAEVRDFRFVLSGLWRYVGTQDSLTVTAGSDHAPRELPISGHGRALTPPATGTDPVESLFAALDAGSVFSRMGRLQKSRALAKKWQRRITGVADDVQTLVAQHFDYDVFYAYGSMLGAVREGGFLGHDDDLDLGYMSRHRDPARIGPELRDIGLMLIDNGWSVEPFGPLLHVYVDKDGGRGQRVDLFPHFFDEAGVLRVPWGMAGTSHVRLEEWGGLVQAPFADGTATIPSAAEAILAQLYGDSWREPQPGFSWKLDRTEDVPEAMMSPTLCDELYWADFYRRTGFVDPSGFCRAILDRSDCPPTVFDLGCGDGRDSFAFADTGRSVLGIDGSAAALARAGRRLESSPRSLDLSFEAGDVTDPERLRARINARLADGVPALFYLRFLHGLSAQEDEALVGVIGAVARPGDMFAAEFRSAADEVLPKAHRSRRRRFRDGDAFSAMLGDRFGFTLLEADDATDRSPYGVEDPYLYRVIARR